jgi:chemotaxis protein MotB
MRQSALKRSNNIEDTWPGLVDVIIATMMILLLFMIIQYIMFFLSDAVKRMEIRHRQERLEQLIAEQESAGKISKGKITCETNGDNQKLRFSSAILFDVGKADIPKGAGEDFLHAVGEILQRAHYKEKLYDQIFIEGHTDSSPIHTAQFPSNWHLSTARAVQVTDFFIEHGYLSPSLSKQRFLGAAGYGEFNFIESEENKTENRRIEILLVYREK